MKISVVIPARDAAETIGAVLDALAAQEPPPDEVIVVDDGSTTRRRRSPSGTVRHVVRLDEPRYRGRRPEPRLGRGDPATSWCSSTPTPFRRPGWSAGARSGRWPSSPIRRSRCARTFTGPPPLGLGRASPGGNAVPAPRRAARARRRSRRCAWLSPRDTPVRWHESYGGEDALFCVDAAARPGSGSCFDPRFHAVHDHRRDDASPTCAASNAGSCTVSPGAAELVGEPALAPPFAALPDPLLPPAAAARDLRPDP